MLRHHIIVNIIFNFFKKERNYDYGYYQFYPYHLE